MTVQLIEMLFAEVFQALAIVGLLETDPLQHLQDRRLDMVLVQHRIDADHPAGEREGLHPVHHFIQRIEEGQQKLCGGGH